ncbi:hypothetical protein BDV11DRAFT_171297 [Aspergillus similis]
MISPRLHQPSKTDAVIPRKRDSLRHLPLAAGAPSSKEVSYILKITPSVVVMGNIRRAVWRGEFIHRLGLDTEGTHSTVCVCVCVWTKHREPYPHLVRELVVLTTVLAEVMDQLAQDNFELD